MLYCLAKCYDGPLDVNIFDLWVCGFMGFAVAFPLWFKMWKTSLLFAVLGFGGWALDKYSIVERTTVGLFIMGVAFLGCSFLSHLIACATVYPLFAVIWKV